MSITEEDLAVDRELAEISGLLPLLRYTTPINTADQFRDFVDRGAIPRFEYLPLPDLEDVEARLEEVDPGRANDPVIGQLCGIKKRELEMIVELLRSRNREGFFLAAVELFGHVDESLVALAGKILDAPRSAPQPGQFLNPAQLAKRAEAEISGYRLVHPELTARVVVSETTAGIRVENGDLYIGSDIRVPTARVEPLLQHEVGVHVLTYANGAAQPLKLLAAGLPGYEENQEALGVLAEYLSGGLAPGRLRVLALRVIASHLRSTGASFTDTFTELRRFGTSRRVAFTTTMRSHRSGGMTRDAGYLRGFIRLLDHIASEGPIDRLLVGKVRLEDGPIVDDLLDRKVLTEPPLTPRFMETKRGKTLLDGLRRGIDILELT